MSQNEQKTTIDDRVLLIRIPRTYTRGMSNQEILEVTRRAWKVSKRCEEADYALAVVRGEVVAVFTIHRWCPSGDAPGRWEFEGENASVDIQRKYVGQNVKHYLPKWGNVSPIVYVNC